MSAHVLGAVDYDGNARTVLTRCVCGAFTFVYGVEPDEVLDVATWHHAAHVRRVTPRTFPTRPFDLEVDGVY